MNLNYQNKKVFISLKKEIRLKKHTIFANQERFLFFKITISKAMRIINDKISGINMKYYYKVHNINILCTLHIT